MGVAQVDGDPNFSIFADAPGVPFSTKRVTVSLLRLTLDDAEKSRANTRVAKSNARFKM